MLVFAQHEQTPGRERCGNVELCLVPFVVCSLAEIKCWREHIVMGTYHSENISLRVVETESEVSCHSLYAALVTIVHERERCAYVALLN